MSAPTSVQEYERQALACVPKTIWMRGARTLPAVAPDPAYARAHANIAWTIVCGAFLESPAAPSLDDARREIEIESWSIGDSGGKSAKQVNPFPPNVYHWYHALALYSAREYEQAIKVLREAQSSDHWSHALLATCYAQTDRMSEAHLEVRAFIRERGLELSERGETLPVNTLELARTCAARYRNPVDRDSRAYAA